MKTARRIGDPRCCRDVVPLFTKAYTADRTGGVASRAGEIFVDIGYGHGLGRSGRGGDDFFAESRVDAASAPRRAAPEATRSRRLASLEYLVLVRRLELRTY